MCVGSTPKPPKAAPPPPAPPQELSPEVIQARNDQRQRALAAAGAQSTIATNAQGQGSTAQVQKTFLGQ